MNALEQKIEFYSRDIDTPWTVNGFRGTWAISDHNLIPDILSEYLQYTFKVGRLRKVPLEDINKALNDIWEGPGSLAKVFTAVDEMRKHGRDWAFPSLRGSKKVEEEDDDDFDLPLSTFGIDSPEEDLQDND